MQVYLFVLLLSTVKSKFIQNFYINNIFKQFLTSDDDVIIATSTNFQNFDFLSNSTNPQLIKNYNKITKQTITIYRHYNYVIVDQNFINFKNTIICLLHENNLNVFGKYLIVLPVTQNTDELVKYFELLWQNEVYNVVIKTKEYYTWYPYKDCGRIITHQTSLSTGFLNKIPKKLNCSLRVNWSKASIIVKNPYNKTDPGIYILLANELSKLLGAPFIYINSSFDFTKLMIVGNSTIFSDVMLTENTTIAFGGFNFAFDFPEKNDYTTYISNVDAIIILPPRKAFPKWKAFFKFSPLAVTLLMLTFLLNGFVIHIFRKRQIFESLFESYQIFIQLSMSEFPKNFYFLSILLFAFIINSIYLGELSGVFTKPNFEPKITSVEDFFFI